MKNLLIGVLIIAVIGFGYVHFKTKQVDTVVTQIDQPIISPDKTDATSTPQPTVSTQKQPKTAPTQYTEELQYNHSKYYVHVDGGQDFVFNQDYRMHIEDTYSGGDFPSHREFMLFKKGDIVQGVYDSKSCSGNGCVPTVRYVIVSVTTATRPVDIAMLTPVE